MSKLGNLVFILFTEIGIGATGLGWWMLFNPPETKTILDIVIGTMLLLIVSLIDVFIGYVVWDSCISEEP